MAKITSIGCAGCNEVFTSQEEFKAHDCPKLSKSPRDPLLVERQKTHGSFALNAAISQTLKGVISNYRSSITCAEHDEALDMIALKLSRILSGQANFRDHWDDIAGYAKLASEACDDGSYV